GALSPGCAPGLNSFYFALWPFSRIKRECALPPLAGPIPRPPCGSDYRRLARQIRDVARQTRLLVARSELLRPATNYSRRGDHWIGIALPLSPTRARPGVSRTAYGGQAPLRGRADYLRTKEEPRRLGRGSELWAAWTARRSSLAARHDGSP